MNRGISTHLRTLLGFVHLALRAATEEERREYLEGIERAARALLKAFDEGPRQSGDEGRTSSGLASSRPVVARGIPRVLLVEDHEINRLLAEEMLRGAGFAVDTAANGAEALGKLEAGEGYDAVLMDLQMPVMDGFEATRAIRQRFSPRQLPVIAMTAHALEEEIEKSRAVGMNDYLIKPIGADLLQGALEHWIWRSDGRT